MKAAEFANKLRSWMENHIGRPRKKGNKNKNSNSNGNAATTSAAAGGAAGCGREPPYKKTVATGYTIHHGNGTTSTTTATALITASSVPHSSNSSSSHSHNGVISSPVRRREVSPIQNHTKSRYGWQSPDQETVTSPKSDNFLYAPQHHRVRTHQHHTAPNSKESSSEDKLAAKQQQPDCSSSSFSSLSWSTGSKEPSMHSNSQSHQQQQQLQQQQQHIKPQPQPQPAPIEFKCNSPLVANYQQHNESYPELGDLDEDPNAVHYEEIRTILRHPDNMANNNMFEHERPKSEQLSSFAPARAYQDLARRSQDDASTRYGRLLPSKIQPQAMGGSIDSLNANHMRSGSAECIPSNNNHHHQQQQQQQQLQRGVYLNDAAVANVGLHYKNAPATALVMPHAQRSRLRSARFGANAAVVTPQTGAGIIAGPLHSLSSPESAYSTGYSTDGTSPGAIYTPPEYYINMRTGTHYFPKSVNSLAIEAQRYKFGLNKIEEMSPIDPLPKTSFANAAGIHKRTDSYDNKSSSFFEAQNVVTRSPLRQNEQQTRPLPHPLTVGCHSPLALRNTNTIVLPTLKGFESPSPRQRCRIRTNPWYSTTDTSSSGTTIGTAQHFMPTSASVSSTISSSKSVCSSTKKMELDTTSTSSSGIKSSNEAGGPGETEGGSSDKNKHHNCGKTSYDSSESSSSLTEVENMQRTYSPNTIRRKRSELLHQHQQQQQQQHLPEDDEIMLYAKCAERVDCVSDASYKDAAAPALAAVAIPVSDDDATLNEMMGKFDESYVYEKETDILSSDSDPTDCISDLDTGQDAGDECDTDELLDIDFIDTASIQEVNDKQEERYNFGSCYYYSSSSPTRLPQKQQQQQQHMETRASVRSRRNSRSLKNTQESSHAAAGSQRRRKRFMKTRKKSSDSREQSGTPVRRFRESRSVGGTPVCLRRNTSGTAKERIYKTSPLSNRSSSLVFTDIRPSPFMTIAESEKALLRADLEADVKYRQLILEAESILVSMKNSVQSIPRDTPVASPRRVNPLANKRVEMLKNCEGDVKREHQKQPPTHAEQELAAAINKRIEHLKCETASAPNSPKFSRLSPRKTHLTNFIQQNAPPPDVPPPPLPRKCEVPDLQKPPQSPRLQLNGRRMQSCSPSASPVQNRRRFRSQSPRSLQPTINLDSDSELDSATGSNSKQHSNSSLQRISRDSSRRNLYFKGSAEDMANHNYLPEIARIMDGGAMTNYCPQSEPLKRKVYKGSSTFERIKKSFDMESEVPKQAMLAKISHLRRERRNSSRISSHDVNHSTNCGNEPFVDDEASVASNMSGCSKKQLILSTIADLKRSLENQSVELNGLNDD